MAQFRSLLPTGLYGLLSFLVALSVAWVSLASVNFLYGVWHDHGGIAEGIERYAPKNRYIAGFADTTRAERLRVFAEINRSVHSGGEGLADIQFDRKRGSRSTTLLREPEVIHLHDVANLIDALKVSALVVLVIWLGWSIYYFKHDRFPKVLPLLASTLTVISVCIVVILLIGAEKVFNQFHIWVFPHEHQWFFYYQDSLMSTMMLAPTLFGYIAVALLLASLVIFGGLLFLMRIVKPSSVREIQPY